MINGNEIDGTKKELMELVFFAHNNKDIRFQVSRMLAKEFNHLLRNNFLII